MSYSFDDAFSTFRANIDGTHFILESVRQWAPRCKVYFAGSSEMFGNPVESPQTERTPFIPRSPYGVSKVTGFHLARNYREAYGLFVSSGILFNHESPRRGYEFVTRKVTSHVARIKLGLAKTNCRWAISKPAAIGAMRRITCGRFSAMLQQDRARRLCHRHRADAHSVRELCELAFGFAGLDYRDHVVSRPEFFRPAEMHVLQGDARKARAALGWTPTCDFRQLVEEMVAHDFEVTRRE